MGAPDAYSPRRPKYGFVDFKPGCDATIDDLIDVLEAKSRSYIPVIYVLNKIDAISIEELDLLYRIPHAVPISSEHGWNIDVSRSHRLPRLPSLY